MGKKKLQQQKKKSPENSAENIYKAVMEAGPRDDAAFARLAEAVFKRPGFGNEIVNQADGIVPWSLYLLKNLYDGGLPETRRGLFARITANSVTQIENMGRQLFTLKPDIGHQFALLLLAYREETRGYAALAIGEMCAIVENFGRTTYQMSPAIGSNLVGLMFSNNVETQAMGPYAISMLVDSVPGFGDALLASNPLLPMNLVTLLQTRHDTVRANTLGCILSLLFTGFFLLPGSSYFSFPVPSFALAFTTEDPRLPADLATLLKSADNAVKGSLIFSKK